MRNKRNKVLSFHPTFVECASRAIGVLISALITVYPCWMEHSAARIHPYYELVAASAITSHALAIFIRGNTATSLISYIISLTLISCVLVHGYDYYAGWWRGDVLAKLLSEPLFFIFFQTAFSLCYAPFHLASIVLIRLISKRCL